MHGLLATLVLTAKSGSALISQGVEVMRFSSRRYQAAAR